MYCINCGVKLADSEKVCPLCNTTVYHPDIYIKHTPGPYPNVEIKSERISRHGIVFILSMLFMLPVIILPIIELRISSHVTWSGLAAAGVILAYCIFVLPLWVKKPNPVVFVPIDFALAAVYLLYIDLFFGGGWFLSLAFPICGLICVIVTTATVLFRYLRRGKLYIWGGIVYALGGSCMLIELFLNITFKLRSILLWSPYPAIVCFVIGSVFVVIATCKPMRETLEKRLFI